MKYPVLNFGIMLMEESEVDCETLYYAVDESGEPIARIGKELYESLCALDGTHPLVCSEKERKLLLDRGIITYSRYRPVAKKHSEFVLLPLPRLKRKAALLCRIVTGLLFLGFIAILIFSDTDVGEYVPQKYSVIEIVLAFLSAIVLHEAGHIICAAGRREAGARFSILFFYRFLPHACVVFPEDFGYGDDGSLLGMLRKDLIALAGPVMSLIASDIFSLLGPRFRLLSIANSFVGLTAAVPDVFGYMLKMDAGPIARPFDNVFCARRRRSLARSHRLTLVFSILAVVIALGIVLLLTGMMVYYSYLQF